MSASFPSELPGPRVEVSVAINRDVGDVFAFLSQMENMAIWEPDTIAHLQTSEGPMDVGTMTRWQMRFLGRSMTWTHVVSEFEPNRKITLKSTSGPFRFDAQLSCAPTEAGTEVTWLGEAERGLGGIFGRLAEPLVVAIFRRQQLGHLRQLKDLLES